MKRAILIIISAFVLSMVAYLILKKPHSYSLNQKGLVLYKTGNFEAAENLFNRSVIWNKKNADALINLVKTRLALKKNTLAKADIEKLAARFPKHPETLALEGQLLIIDNSFELALKKLDLAIEADSLLSYAYYYRGIARANLEDLKGAASDYIRAQELDKANTSALEKGAIALSQLEDYSAAIGIYSKILDMDPSNLKALVSRGTFKMNIGDYKGAITDFAQIIAIDNTHTEAYYNRGKSFSQLERYNEAITDFEQTLRLKYKISGSNFNLGLAYLKLNKPAQAVGYFENSLKYDENSELAADAYDLLGIIEMMQGKSSKSLNYFNKAILKNANFTRAYYNRGIAFGQLKEYGKAIADLKKSIELGEKSSDIYYALGSNTIALNKFEEGCKYLRIASEMGNENAKEMIKMYCKK